MPFPRERRLLRRANRIAALHGLTRIAPAWNAKILLFVGMWVAGGFVAVSADSTVFVLAGFALAGGGLHGLSTFTHESAHGLLSKSRGLNRFLGFLTGAPVLVSVTAYRALHRAHHRHTGDPRDPDSLANAVPSPGLRRIVFYVFFLFGGLIYALVHVPLGGSRLARGRERIRILVEYACILALLAAAFLVLRLAGRLDLLLHGWACPLIVANLIANQRGIAEHMMTEQGGVVSTRTITSNGFARFLLNNANYHLEHHLVAVVPWYRLPRLHALVGEEISRVGAPIRRSYLLFLLESLRRGGLGVARAKA